jgi:hypothetical protein
VSERPRRVATLRVEDAWVEARLAQDSRWVAAYRLSAQDGAVVVSELRLFPHDPTRPDGEPGEWSAQLLGGRAPVPRGGIYAQLVRAVKIGEHQRYANEVLRRWPQIAPIADAIARLGVAVTAPPTPARGGRPRKTDQYFAALARDYVRALGRGSARPVTEMAEARGIKPGAIRDAIHTARERGLLTKVPQGKRGGTLTPKALAMFGERRQEVATRATTRTARGGAKRTRPDRRGKG